MLRRASSLAAGRRAKWVILVVWVIVGVALSPLQPKLQEATTNESEAFLPESAESTQVNDLIEDRFPEGRQVDAIVVYTRDGGLTASDRRRIAADAGRLCEADRIAALNRVITSRGLACDPASGGQAAGAAAGRPAGAAGEAASRPPRGAPSLVSEDGTTELVVAQTSTEDSEEIQKDVDAIKAVVPSPDAPSGELRAYVSGTAGFIADSIDAFESIDSTLLMVTVTLVLVLLLLIYRSPVVALVPLFVVGIAYGIAAGIVYGLVEAGVFEINGQTTGILIVLMFGAGTDYCLLIVARFKEELRRTDDKHAAMANATRRTGPAILSAGGTVFASMLVLALADFKATQDMGPVLSLGIAVMLLVGLTLLPAVLSILGRNAFWPAIPRVGSEQRRPLDIWRRIGHVVHDRPVAAMLVATAVLVAGALGNLDDRGALDFGEGFRDDPDSKLGQDIIDEKLSPGQSAATNVVAATSVAPRVTDALLTSPEVEAALPVSRSDDGELTRIDVTLSSDPFSDQASEGIPDMRDLVDGVAGPQTALIGGLTAENHDTSETLSSDARIIVPLVLLLIFLILVLLLRAVVAPLYLVATVVLSYGFALGASSLFYTYVLNQPDSDPGLPTFAFIFLVALGVDYNIFLISRIREESAKLGNKEGVITGLERTGGVITSAGLILAGTFSALMALPLEGLFQIGFTVALGLLVDTFLVRTILVPSIAFQLGDRNWWPSRRAVAGPEPALEPR
jgi:putative drug exporter of the RND superfamily